MHWQCSLLSLNKEFHLLLLLCTKLKRQPFHTLSHLHLLSMHLFWEFLIQLFGLLLHFCGSYLEELFSCTNVFLIVQISVSYFGRHFPFFDAFCLFFCFFPLFFLFCLFYLPPQLMHAFWEAAVALSTLIYVYQKVESTDRTKFKR